MSDWMHGMGIVKTFCLCVEDRSENLPTFEDVL